MRMLCISTNSVCTFKILNEHSLSHNFDHAPNIRHVTNSQVLNEHILLDNFDHAPNIRHVTNSQVLLRYHEFGYSLDLRLNRKFLDNLTPGIPNVVNIPHV